MSDPLDEAVIDRLVAEVRSLHNELESVRTALARGGEDLHLLTTIGAIQLLLRDRKDQADKIRQLEKELTKMIRSST